MLRGKLNHVAPNREVIAGRVGTGVYNVTAAYTLAIASGTDIVMTSDSVGVAGNALDFEASNDGTATPTMTITFGAQPLVITHATAGTTKNGLTVTLVPGGTAGAEVATEDASGNLAVSYQAGGGGSSLTQVAAAVDGHANWVSASANAATGTGVLIGTLSGGTAATWAEESGTPSKTHLHFSNTVTTVTAAVAALNTLASGTKTMTASGSGAHTVDNADDTGGKVDLSGGVAAVAVANAVEKGAAATNSATGTYTITTDNLYGDVESVICNLVMKTMTDDYAIGGAISVANKTILAYMFDDSGNAIADPGTPADNFLHYVIHTKVTQ
jgi:hypothetical protein